MAEENSNEEEGKGFKVSDRRFSVRGYEEEDEKATSTVEKEPPAADSAPSPGAPPIIEDSGQAPEPPPRDTEPPSPPEQAAPDQDAEEPSAPGQAPREFETLLAILQGNALAAMGVNPQTGERMGGADPRSAKLMVDLVGYVHEKMQGNLSEAEEQVLSQVLSDLRMVYVQQVGIG